MNEINIDKLDLNLLKSLRALLQERHVGRAAERMNVTQSAMSHTLARLREAFDDPLFVRTAKGLAPTARALEVTPRLSLVLSEVNAIFAPKLLDPSQVSRRLVIQTHDFIVASYLSKAFSRLQTKAPGIVFDIRGIGAHSYRELDDGEVDIIIGAGLKAAPKLIQRRFVDEELVCLLDRVHPALNDWCTQSLFRYPHIKMSLLDDRDDPVDLYAKKMGFHPRKVGRFTQSMQMQLAMLAGTELIAFVPASLARQGKTHYELAVKSCPFKLPSLSIKSIWHERNQNDPVHQWIREQISQTLGSDI